MVKKRSSWVKTTAMAVAAVVLLLLHGCHMAQVVSSPASSKFLAGWQESVPRNVFVDKKPEIQLVGQSSRSLLTKATCGLIRTEMTPLQIQEALRQINELDGTSNASRRRECYMQLLDDMSQAKHVLEQAFRYHGRRINVVSPILVPDETSLLSLLYSNYGDMLRQGGHLMDAAVAMQLALYYDPGSARNACILANIRVEQGLHDDALRLLKTNLQHFPTDRSSLEALGELYLSLQRLDEAYVYFSEITKYHPYDERLHHRMAYLMFHSGRLGEGIESLSKALKDHPNNSKFQLSLGAFYQAKGDLVRSIDLYYQIINNDPNNTEVLNNLGSSLYHNGEEEEGRKYLIKAIEMTPTSPEPYINLGVLCMEEGEIECAYDMFSTAYQITGKDGFLIRREILCPQVFLTEEDMISHRNKLEKSVKSLGEKKLHIVDILSEVERPQFYLSYHGVNDYSIQVDMANLLLNSTTSLSYTAAHLRDGPEKHFMHRSMAKIHVAFLSKFFVEDHPHGKLLQGIIGRINRDLFYVTVFAISNPRYGVVTDYVQKHCDKLIYLSMNLEEARRTIEHQKVDILVFADIMSEPVSYALAFSRLAPVQAVFWGNPITSGIPNVDYFISGEYMEDRSLEEEHYSEQVVLLKGQAIWYDPIHIPSSLNQRSLYGFQASWTIYACLQSVFKFHPKYDHVLGQILRRDSNGHVILLEGRRKKWTERFQQRLRQSLPDVYDRIHFVTRVPGSDAFLQLLSVSNVVLHPFPFGGSKTSADALALGLPIVAMCEPFLRGRMAYSFLKRLELDEPCIAYTTQEYIEKAIRLGTNQTYHSQVSNIIKSRSDAIFRDMEVVQEWEAFFIHSIGTVYPPMTGKLLQGRPISLESIPHGQLLHIIQQSNALGFPSISRDLLLVAAKHKTDEFLLNDLGAVNHQLGNYDEAIRNFQEAIHRNPGYVGAWNNLGAALASMNRYDLAIHAFVKALNLEPNSNAVVYNVGNTLRATGNYVGVIDFYQKVMNLTHYSTESIATLVAIALLDLTEFTSTDIFEAVNTMHQQGLINTTDASGVYDDVKKLQNASYVESLNVLGIALQHEGYMDNVVPLYHVFFKTSPKLRYQKKESTPMVYLSPIHLIVQYYRSPSMERQAEVDRCLLENIKNKHISSIHLLTEKAFDITLFEDLSTRLWGRNKVKQVVISRRLSFLNAFQYANNHLHGKRCIVSNADIYFDHTLERVADARVSLKNKILALTRWDETKSGDLIFKPRIDAQDSWIFEASPQLIHATLEVPIGFLRSDNRMALALENIGMTVKNPCLAIVTHHIHVSSQRTYTESDTIPGDFKYVKISNELT